MEINITVLIQMIIFFLYIIFCIKFIWPYINKVIEKRQKKIYLENFKIKKTKNKLIYLKEKIKKSISNQKKKSFKIILKAKNDGINLFKKYEKKAIQRYKILLYEVKQKIFLKKKKIYKKFYKNISVIINKILINITLKIFNDKKKDNKFINKILNKFKI